MFIGYGYQVRITENMTDIDAGINLIRESLIFGDMAVSMEWALQEIRKIQRAAREGTPIYRPRF